MQKYRDIPCSREKAAAILGFDDYVQGQDYYIRIYVHGSEELWGYGESEKSARNTSNTSWFSPGYSSNGT